jgi:hypothetical protein
MTRIILSEKAFDDYLRENIDNIDVSLKETRAYIYSIFKGFLYADGDLSKKSITLVYADARESRDFAKLQGLADWIFLVRTSFPQSLRASEEYYDTVARCSYYRCYVILDRKWPCFEEMADRFPSLVEKLQAANIMV